MTQFSKEAVENNAGYQLGRKHGKGETLDERDAMVAALKQCRTLLSTLKHRNECDQASLDAAIELTFDKVSAALAASPDAQPAEDDHPLRIFDAGFGTVSQPTESQTVKEAVKRAAEKIADEYREFLTTRSHFLHRNVPEIEIQKIAEIISAELNTSVDGDNQ